MTFANMSMAERIVLAASLATTEHVLRSVQDERQNELRGSRADQKTGEENIVDQASKLRERMRQAA